MVYLLDAHTGVLCEIAERVVEILCLPGSTAICIYSELNCVTKFRSTLEYV